MTTIKDVARLANVSVSTVSKYINGGTVRPGKAQAVRSAIEALDYKVNPFARGLKARKSHAIGVLLPNLSAPFFGAVFSSIDQILRDGGYHCLIACYAASHGLERDYLKFLIGTGVDGLIYIPENLTAEEFTELTAGWDVPVIQVDRTIPGVNTDAVITDNVEASCQAVEYLLDQGYRRVAAIVGSMSVFTSRERLVGYLRALDRRGIPYDDELVINGTYDFATGYRGLMRLMDMPSPPTAVFSANYDITVGLITAAKERGLRIPDDIGVFGYDCTEICGMMTPPLPVVQQPEQEIGRAAAEMMLERLSGNDGPPRLVRLANTPVI